MASSSSSSSSSSPSSPTTLKLVINTKTQKVLYAVVGYGLVGFISYLLTIPPEKYSSIKNHLDKLLSVVPASEQELPGHEGHRFFDNPVTFMVLDDLDVVPMSLLSRIWMLNKFNLDDDVVLDEKVVELGPAEAVKLVKASKETKDGVLTSVFLKPKN